MTTDKEIGHIIIVFPLEKRKIAIFESREDRENWIKMHEKNIRPGLQQTVDIEDHNSYETQQGYALEYKNI